MKKVGGGGRAPWAPLLWAGQANGRVPEMACKLSVVPRNHHLKG
jgi:hypothetical protein